ncbi:MAG: transcriptional regulator, LuxR family, partial [Thermomicrobiales bacterium]|nr:transcriptional regulator, LuxR family [Thermomicrobiales bacterium]
LTLTGPGGVGKTALALAIGNDVAAHVGDGANFVELAPLRDPGLVLPVVARALGVPESGDRPLLDRLVAALRQRHLLLVLDNCEHLVTAVAALVPQLLTACPSLQILATSRAPLRVRGEQELPVDPLPLPPLGSCHDPQVADNPAVQLFMERARAVDPRVSVTADALQDVVLICRTLDGLPLAIELAAARVRVLAPAELRDRLAQRLPLLVSGTRDAPARQRTMRDAITWSYDLLAPDEQDVFGRLAVFSGGFTLEAAQTVARRDPAADVLLVVERLVEQHLVRRDDREVPTRYHLLETIREFALEQLDARGNATEARDAHAAYFQQLAEHTAPALYGPRQLERLAHLETEHPNLRVALAWVARQGKTDALLRLAAALWRFWFIRGYPREGRAWLAPALAVPHPWSTELREALHGASMLASNQGDHVQAAAWADHLLVLAQEHHDAAGIARALFSLSFAATYLGDRRRAHDLATQVLAVSRDLGDPHWMGNVLTRLGIEDHNRGAYASALTHYEEAQRLWHNLGCTWELVCVTTDLGVTAQAQGDIARAAAQYRESLTLLQDVGETWMIEELLALVASLAADTGEWERAARLIGATDHLLEAIGFTLAPFVAVFYEQAKDRVCRALGAEGFAAEREAGRYLPRTHALAEAVAIASVLTGSPAFPDAPLVSGLSAREVEVLRLLVEGHSDRQIAAALSISPKTASNHVSSILAKLHVQTRTAAATQAVRRGLV